MFRPDIDTRLCKFIWLGTHQKFDDAFTFIFEETEHGWMWIHAYQFDADTATVIVECTQQTWDAWGFEHMTKEETIATCERVFAKHLGGHALMSNASHLRGSAVWMNFPRVICEQWYHENVVLMGDAAATAHFSIGSGTRLAFDSAIALAELPAQRADDGGGVRALPGRAADRGAPAAVGGAQQPRVVRAGRALPRPRPGAVQLLAAHPIAADLAREPAAARSGVAAVGGGLVPGSKPAASRAGRRCSRRSGCAAWSSTNRVVVSPMAQYKAVDGCPTDWHFVHYAERAKGGAGLVYTEMTCVSPEGRITPGCTGLYAPEHEAAWTTAHRLRARRDQRQDLLPDRPLGSQGLDPARLGADRHAAGRRQLAGDVGLGDPVVDAAARSPRRWTAPTWTR